MEKIRRYDLDWLRILVFGLLIFYHVGMFFVPWGWHIKNNEISGDMRWPMLFVNQWRLASLFLISGMGTRFALSFRTGKEFSMERIKRLLIPLIFGMLVIVAPQVYFERLANDQFTGSYFQFFPSEYFNGIYPSGNFSWHHLWFLPYLLIFSLILSPLFVFLRDHPNNKFINWNKRIIKLKWGLLIYIIPLYLTEAFLEPFFPVTHALVDDWFTFFNFLIIFFYGFLFISCKNEFWIAIDRLKRPALIGGVLAFSLFIFIIHYEDNIYRHFTEALVKVLNMWLWLIAIFGYGAHYLNKQSKRLKYLNEAVYPFYILHQTITVTAAYYLMNLDWSITVKFIILSVITFGGSWMIYEFVRRFNFLRPLFGLKGKFRSSV